MLLFAGSLPCLAQFLPPTMAERYLPATDHWKTYEADNGEQFKADMSRISPWVNGGAMAYVYDVGVDIAPSMMFFGCNGYYQNGAGPEQIAPPRSVIGIIARDVCRVSHDQAKAAAKPTAKPTQLGAWKPFTSASGHFSVLFPAAPRQLKEPPGSRVRDFSSSVDKGHTIYSVDYVDLRPDFGSEVEPQVILDLGFDGDGPRINDKIIDLHGVPGRAFEEAGPSGDRAFVRQFFTWPRLYTVRAFAAKGYTATQADQFLNSFRILDNPPRP